MRLQRQHRIRSGVTHQLQIALEYQPRELNLFNYKRIVITAVPFSIREALSFQTAEVLNLHTGFDSWMGYA